MASVTTLFGNGPGVITDGIDYQIDYSMPIFDGDFSIGATATQILSLEDTPAFLAGFQLNNGDQRLG
jgi:hypothetical protein